VSDVKIRVSLLPRKDSTCDFDFTGGSGEARRLLRDFCTIVPGLPGATEPEQGCCGFSFLIMSMIRLVHDCAIHPHHFTAVKSKKSKRQNSNLLYSLQ
jgi:hypothetical protein